MDCNQAPDRVASIITVTDKLIILLMLPGYDELGTCRTSLVSSKAACLVHFCKDYKYHNANRLL